MNSDDNTARAFLTFPDAVDALTRELHERFGADISFAQNYGGLLFFENAPEQLRGARPWWAKTVMRNPRIESFDSINSAASILRELGGLWAPYFWTHFRRGALIQAKLPYINLKARQFPCEIPQKNIGLWTLIDGQTLLASPCTSSFLPAGTIEFVENHDEPPSRAYLKLQEAFTLLGSCGAELPRAGMRCLDAGAAPGGWTWLVAKMSADVLAVDRSPLAAPLMNHARVSFMKHDAFTLTPQDIGAFDWVLCDAACYPRRLLEWLHLWTRGAEQPRHMVCTVKLQGNPDWEELCEFEKIKGGSLVHLNYNKHELTWLFSAQ